MAKKVLLIGMGSLGSVVADYLLKNTDYELTLFSRSAGPRDIEDTNREKAIAGNVLDPADLDAAVKGQDAVFVALSGSLGEMAKAVVKAMDKEGVKQLIFISSMGIYNEIPAWGADGNLENNPVLKPYREAADVVEASDLDYTVIRPGWFDNRGDIDYQVTKKGEPFGGHDVSRTSIADLVMRILEDPARYARQSLGINRPM